MKSDVSEVWNASITSIPNRNIQRFKEKLHELVPTITELIRKSDHNIGVSEYNDDEYKENLFTYDNDGWNIEIEYRCCGKWYQDLGDYWNPPCTDLIRAWGNITNISASYCDQITDQEIDFSDEDLFELRTGINEILKNIA